MTLLSILALAAAWGLLAAAFVILWRRWAPGGAASPAVDEKARVIAMMDKTRPRVPLKGRSLDRARASAAADPEKFAALIKAWLREGEGDKLGK